jgi:hypothetical protein
VHKLTSPAKLHLQTSPAHLSRIARSLPFLGLPDIVAYLGPIPGDKNGLSWFEYVDSYFSFSDRQAVTDAMLRSTPLDHWLVDVGFARQWNEEKDIGGLLETRSFSEAVAYLYGVSKVSRVKPASVDWDHHSRTLTVRVDAKRFATVSPLAVTPVSDVYRARGRGTLSGLSKDGSFEDDLRLRLSNWPDAPWAKTVPTAIHPHSLRCAHFPSRQDWLQSAKVLISKGGVVEPTLANAQSLLCAVFAAPDWDRLCGAMNRNKALGFRPVIVCTLNNNGSRQSCSIHPDFASACAMWISGANALTMEGKPYYLEFYADSDRHHLILAHGEPPNFPPFEYNHEYSERRVHLQEIAVAYPRPNALAHVLKAGFELSSSDLGSRLQDLFLKNPGPCGTGNFH